MSAAIDRAATFAAAAANATEPLARAYYLALADSQIAALRTRLDEIELGLKLVREAFRGDAQQALAAPTAKGAAR